MALRSKTLGCSKEKRCKLTNTEEALRIQKELQGVDFKMQWRLLRPGYPRNIRGRQRRIKTTP